MAENFVDRARVVMARVKDDTSPLESKISPAIALKYADAFIKVYRADMLIDPVTESPIDISTIPNEDKAKAYIDKLRSFHKEVLELSRVPQAGTAGIKAEEDLIETEFPLDLGSIE